MLPRQGGLAIITFKEQHDFFQQSTASASGLSGLLLLLFSEANLEDSWAESSGSRRDGGIDMRPGVM